jgi:hypothetical protein
MKTEFFENFEILKFFLQILISYETFEFFLNF